MRKEEGKRAEKRENEAGKGSREAVGTVRRTTFSRKPRFFLKKGLIFKKRCGIIYAVTQGHSSVGRAAVSKTACPGFES